MRIKPNESYESWAQRVQEFELAQARRELDKGTDINLVMEAMSARIQQKLLHPIFTAIKESHGQVFDLEANKKAYKEAYLNKNSPKPDHLTED